MNITMIDNFDSFTFNLVDYFRRLDCTVRVYRNDIPVDIVAASEPDLLVFSPGPSTPANAGNLLAYIDHFHPHVPLFGVCLGHQAMIEYFGGTLRVLPPPLPRQAERDRSPRPGASTRTCRRRCRWAATTRWSAT